METVTCSMCKWSVESWKRHAREQGLLVCSNKKSEKYCLILKPDTTCDQAKMTLTSMLYKIIKRERL